MQQHFYNLSYHQLYKFLWLKKYIYFCQIRKKTTKNNTNAHVNLPSPTTERTAEQVLVGGFIAGGIQTGNLKGAVKGGVFAVASYGIGEYFSGASNVAAHMALAGVDSLLSGDNFAHGVLSAGLGIGTGALTADLGKSFEDILAGTILSAIASGTGSLIAGGKFGTGALSGAMRYAFNKSLHPPKMKFNIGDTIFSAKGESIVEFLKRAGSRFIELTEQGNAEVGSRIFYDKSSKIYALTIESSGIPQFNAMYASAPKDFTYTGMTVHTHLNKDIKWNFNLEKKTLNVLKSLRSVSRRELSNLKQQYYYNPKLRGKIPAGEPSFSQQDFLRPGYLISFDGNLYEQHGSNKQISHGSY